MSNIYITKSNGEKEVFDSQKLRDSLKRAGVSETMIKEIVAHIEAELMPDMNTSEIYRHAFSLLNKHEKKAAVNYSVRRALLELGPSGFAFEELVAELYRRNGYKVILDQYVKGKCVEHEIDVVAHKGNELVMVEAKFHNIDGIKSDLKVALYVKARFDDLEGAEFDYGEAKKLSKGILITNTKFTKTAIDYARCSGLSLIGWNYPHEGNLQDLIQEADLHPVTSLASLSKKEKQMLMQKNIFFLRQIKDNTGLLKTIDISDAKQKSVLKELNNII